MPEVDAMQFYEEVASDRKSRREYTLEARSGREVVVDLVEVDRGDILDQISKLPEDMLDALEEAEDPEDAEEEAREQNMLSNVNGDVIDAFEAICAESITHEEWTSHNVEDIVGQLSMDVLFPLGAEIIDFSLNEQGEIEDFQKVD
jgi:hypothetical protein